MRNGWKLVSRVFDNIAIMQDFLPFVLASLRSGKILLSLNLFVLILNCHPLLGTVDIIKAGLIQFFYFVPLVCEERLLQLNVRMCFDCWYYGKRQIFLHGNIVIALNLKFFIGWIKFQIPPKFRYFQLTLNFFGLLSTQTFYIFQLSSCLTFC